MTLCTENRIFDPYDKEGRPAILFTGQSLDDLIVAFDKKVRPIREAVRRYAKEHLGMAVITFSIAGGIDWDSSSILEDDQRDHTQIKNILKLHKLEGVEQDENEIATIVRGFVSLLKTPTTGVNWANGSPMRFLVLIEFSEHLFPCVQNGTLTRSQMMGIESLHLLSKNLAFRKSGNLLMVHGRDGWVDEMLTSGLYLVRLSQPNKREFERFLTIIRPIYPKATFAADINDREIASLISGTPIRALEELMRASDRSGKTISVSDLTAAKERSVATLSEDTLSILKTDRVKNIDLKGRNIQVAVRVLRTFGKALGEGNIGMPGQVVLAGAPGTAKTDLALLTALEANAPAFQMHSPKGSLVGETERKVRLIQLILGEVSPHMVFVDEITEALPLERGEFDGDSGASKAVNAGLLNILSDETRRGKSILIGTTNCPWRMGSAMRSRFVFVPVLHPLLEDFAMITVETAKRVGQIEFDDTHPLIQTAAEFFYQRGANPRHIRGAIAQSYLTTKVLTPEVILQAAKDFCGSTDLASAIYADLWAIKVCSYKSFFPWGENPQSYPFPPHLSNIVDKVTGDIDRIELEKAITHYKPHANL
jgi:ATPase family associated with various cellular activities (AAA)